MNISNLLKSLAIKDVAYNAEEMSAYSCFTEIAGSKFGGRDAVILAIKKNTPLIFTESPQIKKEFERFTKIELVGSARKTLGEISTILYPKTPANLIAVTGTNGKSSVVHYINQLLYAHNIKSASIGTLGTKLSDPEIRGATNSNFAPQRNVGLTTPDSITFNKKLNWLKENEYDYCSIEASSIGLDQFRLFGRRFKVAGFTSFTQDHLDYHKTMESYLEAKLKLFSDYMDENSIAIINNEIYYFHQIQKHLENYGRKYLTYGRNPKYTNLSGGNIDTDFYYKILDQSLNGVKFLLKHKDIELEIYTSILSTFQVANIVLAISSLVYCGFELDSILPNIVNLTAPHGRLERVASSGMGSRIFIDYAHTPDALENVLKEMKAITSKEGSNLILVFGCGGNRDKSKRPMMGLAAEQNADIVIVTDDNPRDEDPATIRQEILSGSMRATEIENRKKAIEFAISKMGNMDILIIAGKGHEDYQIIGNKKQYFSDREVAINQIKNMPK